MRRLTRYSYAAALCGALCGALPGTAALGRQQLHSDTRQPEIGPMMAATNHGRPPQSREKHLTDVVNSRPNATLNVTARMRPIDAT